MNSDAETIAFFNRHPQVNYTMPIQRLRDILRDGAVMSSGKEFLSPTSDCTIEQLIRHEQLIDSNGFAHRNSRDLSLMWNPDLKIYIRPPAKVFIRSFHTNHFKDYLLIIKDWLNTLTNTGSVDRSRTFARGLLIMNFFSNVSVIEEDFLKEVEYSASLRLH